LLTRLAIVFCLLSLALFYRDVVLVVHTGRASLLEGALLAILIAALVYGSLVYLLARCGYLRRSEGSPLVASDAEAVYEEKAKTPTVCVLIPSYKEEIGVLRQTIVSAALAEFPSRRVVVLIDDPVTEHREDHVALQCTREMILALAARFRLAFTRLLDEQSAFELRRNDCDLHAETRRVAALYEGVATWVGELGDHSRVRDADARDHTDEFFIESVIAALAQAHRLRAEQLRESICDLRVLEQEYRRLAALFNVDITSFERKQYANLSHAPNKAMNLNSYIGMMGKTFRVVDHSGVRRLERCDLRAADLVVPDADYLLTLDADSLVLRTYMLKLVAIMESDQQIAVAQTPYSAVPGSRNRLERAAGAQTDVQYIVHQGFTACNATFWVGANALLRLAALRDIETTMRERGEVVSVFIQDRTVIEDTGSTIDLVRRGWRLHNHPERLAFSATPPDFGSLIIQRRRWSNGGLIIFPDLLKHALTRKGPRPLLKELLMRAHYLCSPALVSLSVLVLLLVPFDSSLQSPWVAATALPYYALYARDLRQSLYRWSELPQVYALGLMLLPVNMAGVLRSLQQIVTGRKSAFGRTPKVENRTPTPPIHLLFQFALLCAIGVTGSRYVLHGHYGLALFCAVNFAMIVAGIALLIGPRNAFVDLFGFIQRKSPPPRQNAVRRSMPAQVVAGESDRITAMDGLRAYAISLVFLVHFLSQYFNGATSPKRIDFDAFQSNRAASIVDVIAHYFWASHYGVDLFFLLSGFLIYRLMVRPAFQYPAFLRNRFLRLYPAFVIALAIYCVYIAYAWDLTYDWFTVAANMLMLQGVWELGIKPIIVPTWSLTFEWLFYLVFPMVLLLPSARTKVSLRHIVLFGLTIAVTVVPIGPHYIRFLMFFAGAALASIPAATVRTQLQRIPDLVVLGVYVLANVLFVAQQDYYRFIPVFLVTSLLLVAKVIHGDGVLHRMFAWEPLRRLGRVSYSFYLFHGLVIIIVCDHLAPLLHGLPEPLTFVLLLGCSSGCSVAIASASYRLLEQPYFQHRNARLAFTMGSGRSASG